MEPKGLDELLGEPQPETVVQEVPAVESEPETVARDEQGRFAPKPTGEEPPATEAEATVPPAEPSSTPEQGQFAALKDERRKRQEAEARISDMERKFQEMQAKQPAAPAPDLWEDPDGYFSQRFQMFGEQLIQKFQQQQIIERIDQSEQQARSRYTDFDEKLAAFRQAAQLNPAIVQEMQRASDPAEFAYGRGKTALEIERHGSLDDLLKAERAKWEAEARAAIPPPATAFPNTTATDGSVGSRSGPAWSGSKSLDELLR